MEKLIPVFNLPNHISDYVDSHKATLTYSNNSVLNGCFKREKNYALLYRAITNFALALEAYLKDKYGFTILKTFLFSQCPYNNFYSFKVEAKLNGLIDFSTNENDLNEFKNTITNLSYLYLGNDVDEINWSMKYLEKWLSKDYVCIGASVWVCKTRNDKGQILISK